MNSGTGAILAASLFALFVYLGTYLPTMDVGWLRYTCTIVYLVLAIVSFACFLICLAEHVYDKEDEED